MLHHEIGHFVFFLVIGGRVKKRWVAAFRRLARATAATAMAMISRILSELAACGDIEVTRDRITIARTLPRAW